MSESIYFLDDKQALIKVVHEDKIIECIQTKEITSDKSELMNDTLSVSVLDDDKIRDASFMAVREEDKSFSMYKIIADSDPRGRLSFVGVSFAVDELSAFVVSDIRPKNKSMKAVAEQILEATNSEWRVGHVDATLPAISGSFYYISVKEALIQLQTFGCEILFKCTITGNKVTDKWIEVYKQIGVVSNKRFVYGSNALEVVRQRDRSQLYTSIIGRGKGEEVGDGYGRRIEFTDVEWKKSSGNPLDKPKGQNWLEYPEMTALYGMPTKSGAKRKRETVLIFDDIEDPKELLQATYENLVEYSRPLIQFKTNVLGADSIGNIVQIHRLDKGYHYKTRVFSVKLDRVTGKAEAGLGDNLNMSSTRQAAIVQNNISNLTESKMTFYQSTEIGKYQDDIMRGAGKNGGSVYWVNGIEAGVSNSREVYETVYMDGPSIAESQHFLVQNNAGISFKHCQKGEWTTIQDVHNGSSNTAWTLDGTFVADFIKAGILSGILVQGVALKTLDDEDFQVVMEGGKVTFEKQVVSTGLDDVHGEELGRITATYGGGRVINGFAVVQDPSYIFSINSASKDNKKLSAPILQVPEESTADNRLYNFYGKGTFGEGPITFKDNVVFEGDVEFKKGVKIVGRLDAGSIYSGGQQVYPGGSGGGVGPDGATYEPINIGSNITGNANIVEWLEKYTKLYGIFDYIGLAYALIMVENPSTDGTDDIMQSSESAGLAPNTLSGEASVKQGCKHLAEQIKNGQDQNVDIWGVMQGYNFGSAYIPWLANRGGKNTTDLAEEYSRDVVAPSLGNTTGATYPYVNAVSQADGRTYLYVNGGNFHYAAMIRQYVKVNESVGYVVPISKPVTVTSEFGYRQHPITGAYELHNGIDLVNGNPTTPIYASAAGEVVIAGSYPEWYGNYVVIKHSDGLYTGYAHQSQLRVSVGDTVKQGQQIGNMGTTGPSTGPHLHFQFFTNGPWPSNSDFINPREHINF